MQLHTLQNPKHCRIGPPTHCEEPPKQTLGSRHMSHLVASPPWTEVLVGTALGCAIKPGGIVPAAELGCAIKPVGIVPAETPVRLLAAAMPAAGWKAGLV